MTTATSQRPTGATRERVPARQPAPQALEDEAVLQVRAAVVAELEVLRRRGMARIGDHPAPPPPPHQAERSRVPAQLPA